MRTIGEVLHLMPQLDDEQRAALKALYAEQTARRKARGHRRGMTVAGAVVGGLVAGPAGAVGLGMAENVLNQSQGPMPAEEMIARRKAILNGTWRDEPIIP